MFLHALILNSSNRRIYQCLREMVAKQKERGYTLAQEIALGKAYCENTSKNIISLLASFVAGV